jgi:GMP synthase (glutamine-hydrolysing)
MILIVDCGSSKIADIQLCVDEFMDYKTITLTEISEGSFDNIKGVILSGANLLITENNLDIHLIKVKMILNKGIPLLGISFGHQIIGLAHGAFASRMKEDRDWQVIESFEENPLWEKLPNEIEMIEDHCESISVPNGFKLLASSDTCVNEAMQHDSKLIFGVQFHPEVSGNYGRVIFENFIKLCN